MTLKTDSTHKWRLDEFDNELGRTGSKYNAWLIEKYPEENIDTTLLYSGRADEVTEEQASEWINTFLLFGDIYYTVNDDIEGCLIALDSFHSAHTKEFVIITKQKI